jgi:nitrite reductase/ring-hydroxylating ferredoxin subunit
METGAVLKPATGGPCLATYPAKVEDGIVLVDVTSWLKEGAL